MEKKLKTIIGILVVFVLLLAGALVYIIGQKTDLKNDKDVLISDVAKLQQEYATLSSTNDTINVQLQVEREKVAELIEKIKKTEATNRTQLNKYQKELGTLRSIMKSYITQIDSLNQLNIALKEETAQAKKEAQESATKYNQLKTTTDELSKQVDKGSVIRGRGLTVIAINGRDKETNRSSRTEKLKTCISLIENSIAKTGLMKVYVRVKGPDGILLTAGDQELFTVDDEQLICSASREVDYQGEELEVCIYFVPGVGFTKGVYTVEAYTDRGLMGTTEIYLK